jgi:hypothetical protein
VLIVYVAGAVAPESVAVTAESLELLALSAPVAPSVPKAVRLLVTAATVLWSEPSAVFSASTFESCSCSSVSGTSAVCTALLRMA